jgi:hypothetical protein
MTFYRRLAFVGVIVGGLFGAPPVALAQDAHWGVVGSFVPQWKVPTLLENLFDGTVDIKGTDISIGIARGRDRGGDWGVSFIHKTMKDGSLIEKIDQVCFSNGCFNDGGRITTRGVTMNGLEVHKYVPFGTIRDRVQIGMNFAGGFGNFNGQFEELEFNAERIPPFNANVGQQTQTLTVKDAKELIDIPVVPLLKIQAAVGVIASPSFKIRFQGGLDVPGYEIFSVSGVYFFGAN